MVLIFFTRSVKAKFMRVTINNIFIQVENSINKTNLFRGGNHSSVVFAGSRDIGINKLYK